MIGTRRCNASLSETERVGFVTRLNYPHMHIAKEVAICKFMWRLQHVRNAWALMRSCLGLWLVMRQCINHLALKADSGCAHMRILHCSPEVFTSQARQFPTQTMDTLKNQKKKNQKKNKQIRKRKQTVAATTTTTTVTATAKEAQQQQQ